MNVLNRAGRVCKAIPFILSLCVFLSSAAFAGTWARSYSSGTTGHLTAVSQTADGGYAAGGTSCNVQGSMQYCYALILKLDADGQVEWSSKYVDFDSTTASVEQTADGGYIVAGTVSSYTTYNTDAWVMKLDGSGNFQWRHLYQGANDDYVKSVRQTSDGGYIVAGRSNSAGAGGNDVWLSKISAAGSIEWQRTFGGAGYDAASVTQTYDGGYMLGGTTNSFGSNSDALAVKLDGNGNIQWRKTFDNNGASDSIASVVQTTDEGYLLAGSTSPSAGRSGAWMLKLDGNGNAQWRKSYDAGQDQTVASLAATGDGGYVIAGKTAQNAYAIQRAWLMKVDASGAIVYQKSYGGEVYDDFRAVAATSDNGAVAVGATASYAGGWAVKVDNSGAVTALCPGGLAADTSVVASDITAAEGDPSLTTGYNFVYSGAYTDSTASTAYASVSGVCFDHLINVSPEIVDFGTVPVGTPSARTVTIWNSVSFATLHISSISLSGGSDFGQSNNCGSDLPGGASCTVTIGFDPSFPGAASAALTILSDDPATPEKIVPVSGIASGAVISLQPGSVSFGPVTVGQTATGENMTVSNDGNADLVISGISVAGSAAGDFSRTSDCTTVAPGGSCTIATAFHPTVLGDRSAVLTIASNAVNGPADAPLDGSGVDAIAPSVTVTATPDVLEQTHKMADVTIGGSAIDNESGIASVVITVTDEYGEYNMTVPGFGSTIQLEANRKGNDDDGRHYTITAVATDLAGNTATATTEVVVVRKGGI